MHVYGLLNKVNGKLYIGKSSRNLGVREREHIKLALKGATGCTYLYSAIRKYGAGAFEICLLSGWALDAGDLNRQEREFIAKFRTNESAFGYNLTEGGDGMCNPSPEVRNKMRLAKLGVKQSSETIAKRAEALVGNTWNVGRVQPEEERKMRSDVSARPMLGKHHSYGTRQKISESVSSAIQGDKNPFFGRHHSDETKRKISDSNSGRKQSREEIQKRSASLRGKVRTDETRKRISEAAKKRGVSQEHIMRMVAARRAKKEVS